MKNITIVYYGYINPKVNWWNIIGEQLVQLKNTGILEVANLYIHLSGDESHIDSAKNKIANLLPESIISSSNINQFEYRGIHLVWELAKINSDHIYLYFHSKGISHNVPKRTIHERQIFKGVIEPWKRVLDIFNENPHINKVGLSSSKEGFIWFNFWWARGTYLMQCEEPIITERRHYYEDWLHRKIKDTPLSTTEECFSLCDNQNAVFCEPVQACQKAARIKL